MNSAKSNNWPLLLSILLFVSTLLTPVVYVVAALAGWIDWATWSPIALTAALLAWTTASWINGASE